jgi:hypothetical protein
MLQVGIKLTALRGRAKLIPPANLKKERDPHSECNKNVGRKINGIELQQITCNARGSLKNNPPPPPPILCISGTVFKIYLNYCVDLALSCSTYSCGWICIF